MKFVLIFSMCLISFNTDRDTFEKALLKYHRIRDCVVRLERLDLDDIIRKSTSQKLLLKPQAASIRSNVSWMPTTSSTRKNSSEALFALSIYHKKIDFTPTVAGKNVKRQRAKSMYTERAVRPQKDGGKNVTIDDLNLEFNERYNRPNRGLKPASDRQLPQLPSKPITQYQKIFNEFLEKVAAKENKK